MNEKRRIGWIDIAKGICMISVVAGHLGVAGVNKVVFSYHLTVFFLLSGYTLKNNLSLETVGRRFHSLMIPYFFTCIAVTAMDVVNMVVLNGTREFAAITRKIAYDLARSFLASGSVKTFGSLDIGGRIGAIWFLPATFFAVVLVQFLLKYVQDRKTRYTIAVPAALLACLSARFIWLPFSIQSAFLAAPVVLLGYDLKELGLLTRLTWKRFALCLGIFLLGLAMNKTPIYFATASISDYGISAFCGLASSLCILYLSQKLEFCKPLSWVGRNSIYFLCIHLFEMETMGKWFRKLLEQLGLPFAPWPLFVVKMIFITAVTAGILLFRKVIHAGKKQTLTVPETKDSSLNMAKAVLAVLLLVGQLDMDGTFGKIVSSISVPALVFYAGYCFRPVESRNFLQSLWGETKELLLPYGLLGVGYILLTHDGIWIEMQRLILGLSGTRNLLGNVASLNLVCLILLLLATKILYMFLDRFVPQEKLRALCVLGCSLLGVYLGKWGYWLPWSLDCALYALALYYLGYCFRQYGIMEYILKRNWLYFVLSTVWAYMIYSGSVDLVVRKYDQYSLGILGAVCGSVLLYAACRYLNEIWGRHLKWVLCQVGENILYILIVHAILAGMLGGWIPARFSPDGLAYAVFWIGMQVIFGTVLGMAVACGRKSIMKLRRT